MAEGMSHETWLALSDLRWQICLLLIETAGEDKYALRNGLNKLLDENGQAANDARRERERAEAFGFEGASND